MTLLLTTASSQADVLTPAVSIAGIELNGKKIARVSSPSYQPDYLDACVAKLPSHIRWFRENCEGMPTADGVPYDWASSACSWVDDMASRSFFSGYVFETLGQQIMHAHDWDAVGEAQSRWRTRQLVDHLGTNLRGLLCSPGNEPDNDPLPGGAGFFLTGGASIETALDRMLRMSRITWEERGDSPIALLGPAIAFPTWNGGSGLFNLIDLLCRNDNELLGYLDGINTHAHTACCTRWHNFDGSAPSDGANSTHHVGRVMAALGFAKPWTSFESGYAWDNNEPNGIEAHMRFGSHLCGLLRYGISWWALYCHAKSGHDPMNISEPTPPFAKRTWYDAATMVSEPTQYMRPVGGQLDIVAKPVAEYGVPPWFVLVPHNRPLTDGNRVVMLDGVVQCTSGGRNIVARPVWLEDLSSRTVSVHAEVAGGAQAKLCVYGFDKLNMLAQSVQPITSAGEYTVTFQPRLHNNPLIPDPNYALVWLDHNGTGTVEWSEPSIV